ncbi:MAG: hypothetical protein RMJ43_06745 [Chloroherpetonaceae bacterium]|nr:hypothetical protein [Chthonomonadaceae bacterium]MDW8207518.1 hypothetical protein [Chloroherpetonaceae bacterium]
MLRYNEATRARILDGIKKYSRIVAQARQRGMNERDTADIVRAMLGDTLGFDPFFEVLTDISVRGNYADFAVFSGGKLLYLVCVKSIQALPNATHLFRLSGTSTPPYASWVVLTNADTWATYRLGIGMDRHPELVCRVSLLETTTLEERAALFYLISKEGAEQNALELYWEQTHVLHPGRLATLILSTESLDLLRRELQRTLNYRIDPQALHDLLVHHVLRPEAVASRYGADASRWLPHCFAYVRDPNRPTTWRLHYRNPDGSPNPDLLTQAVAELSAGFNTLGIPADDVPLVVQRLRQAYTELGIPAEELPPILRNT